MKGLWPEPLTFLSLVDQYWLKASTCSSMVACPGFAVVTFCIHGADGLNCENPKKEQNKLTIK